MTTISGEQYIRAIFLLNRTNFTPQQIGERLDMCENSVRAIAKGYRPPDADNWDRCDTCGALVQMPCRLCAVRRNQRATPQA